MWYISTTSSIIVAKKLYLVVLNINVMKKKNYFSIKKIKNKIKPN